MKTMKPSKIALAGTVVAAVALVGCLDCCSREGGQKDACRMGSRLSQ